MKVVVYIKKKIIAVIIRFFMHTMNFFITMDDKMVLYLSFDGRSYSDNPKAIYETMLTDAKFDKYQLVWALKEPVIISGCKVIKKQSSVKPQIKQTVQKKHISTQRYVCLYSIGVMPFSLSCGLSKLYHAMKSSICCINSVSFSGTNNSKDSLLR